MKKVVLSVNDFFFPKPVLFLSLERNLRMIMIIDIICTNFFTIILFGSISFVMLILLFFFWNEFCIFSQKIRKNFLIGNQKVTFFFLVLIKLKDERDFILFLFLLLAKEMCHGNILMKKITFGIFAMGLLHYFEFFERYFMTFIIVFLFLPKS